MRKLSVLLMLLLPAAFFPQGAKAQDPTAGILFIQYREFTIPFKNDPNLNFAQIRLYVSTDQGQNWQLTANALPDGKHFRFLAPKDGYYWFAAQTVFKDGKVFPSSVSELKSDMKVIVDTVPPTVQVQPLPARNTEVGVSWKVTDDNLDVALPDSVRVEYRPVGAANWIAVPIALGASQVYWNPQTNAQVEVRVRARDKASNIGQDLVNVSLGNAPAYVAPVTTPDNFKDLDRKFVNSKQINLTYDLKDVGPSGVSAIELWYSLYKGRAWNKLTEYPIDVKNPADVGDTKKLTFEVKDEGIYGITLVAKSGVGLGDRPPQPGERPQFWIEVDTTKPIVQILGVQVGHGIDKGKLTTTWNARDKNLGNQPIRISYSEQRDGPWNTIADKAANTGKHTWTMPDGLPYQFYVRIEAVDLAGNIGDAITQDKVKVDLSQPKARPLSIEPGGK